MRKRIIALLLALILTVGLLPTVALAADAQPDVQVSKSDDNLNLVKTIKKAGENYTVTLESWATGAVTTETTPMPLDIILVLDESGSMSETFSSKQGTYYEEIKYYRTTQNYYKWSKEKDGIWYKDTDNNYYKVTVQREQVEDFFSWHYKFTYTYSKNGTAMTIGSSERKNTNPGYTFYRQYTGNVNITKREALVEAATNFADSVYKEATNANGPDHRIAVVTYSGDAQIKTGTTVNNALISVKTGLNAIKSAINGLQTDGGTYINEGIQKANNIFEKNPIAEEGKRARVMIVFTDGAPGRNGIWCKDRQYYYDTHEIAQAAIKEANTAEQTYKATVYTIGIFQGANVGNPKSLPTYTTDVKVYNNGDYQNDNEKAKATANSNRFMHLVSSNYPDATSMTSTGNYNAKLEEDDNNTYYLAAASAGELSDVFTAISSSIKTDTTELNETATIIDNIPGNFTIPAEAQGIKVYTAKCAGKTGETLSWKERQASNLQPTTTTNATTGVKSVSVTGFDYSDEWCGLDENSAPHGSKLIIEFTIKHNNYGGTQPTNAGASIKDEENKDVITVDNPSVPVTIAEPRITGASETKIYDGEGIDVIANIKAAADALVTDANKGKNQFVTITVAVKVDEGTTYTYTIPAGAESGSWGPTTPTLTTGKDVNKYEYDLTITYTDATPKTDTTTPADPKTTSAKATYTITKRPVTLTSETASKPYDGTSLTKPEVTVTDYNDGKNVFNSEFTAAATGTITDPGDPVTNTITVTPKNGALESNYEITKNEGKLTITQDETTKITVTITGKNTSKEYDGTEHVAEGYDVSVSGANANDVSVSLNTGKQAKANGTDVKSEGNGEYRMGLTKGDFTVTSNKYKNIEVTYIDGYVKITPAQVTLTSETASKDYDGTALTKPEVTVGGAGATVFKNEVTDIKANGSVIDPGPAVTNTITYTPGANFKATNYNISKSEGNLSINDIAGPTNLPKVNVYCTNGVANHQESTGNTLKNNTYTSVVSKNAEGKYICTITLTDKTSYISDYNTSTAATHTSDSTRTDFTAIVLYYDTVKKEWPTPIVNFALFVKCDTPTVNVTYTWDGFDSSDFDTNYPEPTKPGDATPDKGSDYTVDSWYNNSSIAIGKDGVRYKFSGWSTSNAIITADGKIESIQTDVTLTGTWTKLGSGTFNLNDKIFKVFDEADGSRDIPRSSYTFEVKVTRLDKETNELTDEKYTGTVTLDGATAAATPSFVFHNPITFHIGGEYRFRVEETPNTVTALSSDERIDYDNAEYYLYVTVSDDLKTINYRFEHVLVITSAEEEPAATENQPITFHNYYYAAKDPGTYDINFSDLVFKVLTKTGDRSFNGAEFTATVEGWQVNQYDVMSARVIKTHFVDLQPVTLKATFPANTTFDADGKAYRAFTGDKLTVTEGEYLFLIDEINDGQTNITYDESKYWLNLGFVENAEGEVSLAGQRVRKFVDGDTYETVLALEDNEWMVVDTSISPVYFENTIDTGKDDYYPIIIPTIINKDTGMLNKTDHFAYVIGYPDGTVHPNGQITRAEVATIFFRLLRDEVRDGAFTTSNTYSDVAYGKWYNNPISTMSALGIITGYPDGTFKPNKPITRAEFAAIAARFDETQSGKSATFSDVIGHWAAKEIGIAYYNDWIKGYPDGTFKPDQNITRAEAMTLINRVLERKPESPADLLTNMNKWTDNMDTSKWYYLDVQEATNSHGYTRKTFNYELWRQMLPDPDWSRYER